MTTRAAAEVLLFDVSHMGNEPAENVNIPGYINPAEKLNTKTSTNVDKPKMCTMVQKPIRHRVSPIYCPTCKGWVDVRLNPVRLHCRGCELEAKP